MKRWCSGKTVILTILMLLMAVGFSMLSVFEDEKAYAAENDATSLTAKYDVKSDKSWTVEFSQNVDPMSIGDNIYVSASPDGNEKVGGVGVSLSKEENKVVISAPTSGWTSGNTYYVFVNEGVKSAGGQELNGKVTMQFTIEEEKPELTDDLYMIKKDGKYGFMNSEGEIVIAPSYDDADYEIGQETENLAAVKQGNYWGYIDKEGNTAIDFQYEEAENFSEGLAKVEDGDYNTGYINSEGVQEIPLEYTDGKEFSDGIAAVAIEGNTGEDNEYAELWGCIDKNNNVVIDFKYEKMEEASNGLVPAKLNGKWGYINFDGDTVIDFKFDYAYKFSEGFASVKVSDLWGYIDESGDFLIEPQYTNAFRFSGGLANVANMSEKFGYINGNNEFVIQPQFDWAISFHKGLARVRIGDEESGEWGYIDTQGNFVYEPTN